MELIHGGSSIPLIWENRAEFIAKVMEFKRNELLPQISAIQQGFYQLVPRLLVSIVTAKELEERIAGKLEIDVDYLKSNTEYYDFEEEAPVIQYFWSALRSFTNEQRAMFLRFVWGRSTLPATSDEFTEKFCIFRLTPTTFDISEDQMLPQAHTCSFQVRCF